jgi:hypothetical protein
VAFRFLARLCKRVPWDALFYGLVPRPLGRGQAVGAFWEAVRWLLKGPCCLVSDVRRRVLCPAQVVHDVLGVLFAAQQIAWI